jgi:hypothetical protein
MNRRRMTLTLAMLFIVGLLIMSFGNWLWAITDYFPIPHGLWVPGMYISYFFWKPYGALGLVLVICGALVLAVAFGLLFDWYHLLILKPVEDKLGVQK